MSNVLKSKIAKAGFGLLVGAFAFAGTAGAVSTAGMTSTGSCYQFTTALQVGSKGDAVTKLQTALGISPATGYFGALTKKAVMTFQTSNGLSAVGMVGPATRAKLNAMCASGSTGSTTGSTGSTGSTTGPVSVMVSSDTPAAGTIIAGQATADLMHVTFTGTGTVNSVTLTRMGVSDQNTLTNVYLYDGVTRLTDGYSFNTNSTLTINNLNLSVAGSRTISVKADVSSMTNSYDIKVALTTFTSGTTANTVNLMGNDMYIAISTGTLASVGLSGSNSVSAATVNAGVTGYAVWRQALQVNTRSLMLKAANFRVSGSAPSDTLANVGLYIDGVKAGPQASMTMTNGSNYLSFDMSGSPVTLTTGSHTFEVRADVVKGSSYNFTVALQQASDLMVMDPQVGVNLAVCGNTSCTASFTSSTAGQIGVGTGSVTIVIDPTFNSLTTTTGGASNSVIAKFKVHGYGEDVKVTSLAVTPVLGSMTPSAAGLQNVNLYFNGSQVGSATGSSSWTSGALTFNLNSQMIVPAGQDSTIEVHADLRTTGGVSYTAGTVSANLATGTAEGFNSHSSVTTPAATGNTLSVQSATLSVAKNVGYASQYQSPNTAGVKIGSYYFQNSSSSEAVRVTSLTVNLTTDGTTVMTSGTTPALTNFSGLRTSELSGSGNSPVQAQGSNTFSVDFTLAPGASKIIDILADTSSQTGAVVTTLTATSIGVISNVSSTSSLATGQTVTMQAGSVGAPVLLTASSTSARYVAAGDPTGVASTGATDATDAAFTFVSTGGAATINKLKFAVTGTGTVTGIRIAGTSFPATQPDGSGIVSFQGPLNLAVPNGGAGLSIDALVSYAPVGNGVTPGTTSSIALTYVEFSAGGTTSTLCLSGGGCTTTISAVAAPTMTLVGSVPTVTVSTTQNTGLNISGESKLGEVTVTASNKGNVKINDLVFNLSSSGFSTAPTGINMSTVRIADGNATITGSSCGSTVNTTYTSGTVTAGSNAIVVASTADMVVGQTIMVAGATAAVGTVTLITDATHVTVNFTTGGVTPAGAVTSPFSVRCEFGSSSNTDFDGYTIQGSATTGKVFSLFGTLVGAAATGSGTPIVSSALDQAKFNWDDTSTNGGSGSKNLNGTLIYNFPTASYSIRQ